MIDLESCPFCGGKNLRYEFQRFMDVASIRCMDCGATGPDTRNGDTFAGLYWNCCKSRLEWTKARPTKPGFYFFKPLQHNKRTRVIEVKWGIAGEGWLAKSDKTPFLFVVEGCAPVDNYKGQWAGPIPEPVEKE